MRLYDLKLSANSERETRKLIATAETQQKNMVLKASKKWLREGRAIVAKGYKSRRLYPGLSVAKIKAMTYANPKTIPSVSRMKDVQEFYIRPSKRRLNLYTIPYKTRRVPLLKKGGKGVKTSGLKKKKINQILTRVFGRPFEVKDNKSFFIVNSGIRGRYFYAGQPKRSEKPISLARTGDDRLPIKKTTAPSLNLTAEQTTGLHSEIQTRLHQSLLSNLKVQSDIEMRRLARL